MVLAGPKVRYGSNIEEKPHTHHAIPTDPSKLGKYDIGLSRHSLKGKAADYPSAPVITTYNVISSEYFDEKAEKQKRKRAKAKKAAAEESDNTSDGPSLTKDFGPLYQAHFHRVILDEAHTIKNRNAKVSKAACEIEAKYRWW